MSKRSIAKMMDLLDRVYVYLEDEEAVLYFPPGPAKNGRLILTKMGGVTLKFKLKTRMNKYVRLAKQPAI